MGFRSFIYFRSMGFLLLLDITRLPVSKNIGFNYILACSSLRVELFSFRLSSYASPAVLSVLSFRYSSARWIFTTSDISSTIPLWWYRAISQSPVFFFSFALLGRSSDFHGTAPSSATQATFIACSRTLHSSTRFGRP